MAAQPLRCAEPGGEREDASPVLAPQELRGGDTEAPEESEPGREHDDREGQQPGELIRLHKEGAADPPEAGKEIAEAEPPADGEGRHEPPDAAVSGAGDRPVDQPHAGLGSVIQRIGKAKKGGSGEHRERARAEGDSASPPAPGEDDRICQAIHGPAPIRSADSLTACS